MRKLSHKEVLTEGFGSFMKKVGAGLGAATREVGKQLAKDAPALVGAAKGIAGIVKDINATDPLKAVQKYFTDDDYAREHYKDDIRSRNALGRPTQDPNNKNIFIIPINNGTYVDEKGGKEEVMDLAGGRVKVLQTADNKYQFNSVTSRDGKSIGADGGPAKPDQKPVAAEPESASAEPEAKPSPVAPEPKTPEPEPTPEPGDKVLVRTKKNPAGEPGVVKQLNPSGAITVATAKNKAGFAYNPKNVLPDPRVKNESSQKNLLRHLHLMSS